MNFLTLFLRNKVIWYLVSRYFTYFIQFITSILIAVKLGPYYFGIWGFLLLILNYFQISNFGISNSINILLVQNKNNTVKSNNLIKSAYFLIGILWVLVLLLNLFYYLFGMPIFDKYEIGNLFFAVSLIALFAYINNLLMTIYRVKNSLFEIAFFQSIIPTLVFISIFLANEKKLLFVLLTAYLIGHLLSFIFFVKGKLISKDGIANYIDAKTIINKGIYLFIYNICYYLVIISIRTIVSIFYTVEEFGFFTFSFTLANSILLLLEALTFVIFPKVIDKLNSDNAILVENTIRSIRTNYVTLAHGLIYIALIAFPILLYFIPQYQNTLQTLSLISLTIVLYTNSFGYNSYLMARNKEKKIAIISFSGLIVNIIIALTLVYIFKTSYTYVIVATMITYLLYAFLYVYFGKLNLKRKIYILEIINETFPIGLIIPYIAAIFLVVSKSQLAFIPFILFLILNLRSLKSILETLKLMITKPSLINISNKNSKL